MSSGFVGGLREWGTPRDGLDDTTPLRDTGGDSLVWKPWGSCSVSPPGTLRGSSSSLSLETAIMLLRRAGVGGLICGAVVGVDDVCAVWAGDSGASVAVGREAACCGAALTSAGLTKPTDLIMPGL